jgi:hypothetical protein
MAINFLSSKIKDENHECVWRVGIHQNVLILVVARLVNVSHRLIRALTASKISLVYVLKVMPKLKRRSNPLGRDSAHRFSERLLELSV